ncbi:MAG: hypothetical protein K8F91_10235 [Candidatus Obscuribacterales bacterium]|nr:hypothetical protein [Candidatus Obscuribacterales bacterium]
MTRTLGEQMQDSFRALAKSARVVDTKILEKQKHSAETHGSIEIAAINAIFLVGLLLCFQFAASLSDFMMKVSGDV